jgi:photosystem II stability/assembly factor-like uncharacterized protein
MKNLILFLGVLCSFSLYAQDVQIFKELEFRNVGPVRGGRVTAVAGVASQPSTFYMGSTGGGLWKTDDFGTSWSNISDGFFATPSVGDIKVAQNDPNVIYVGTGTDGMRSNIIAGKGVYKSLDAGQTWMNIGLEKTGHIGAVEIHPENHNIAYVAAIGQAFNPNPERGVFRTKDGGKNWEKVLFISDTVGIVDLVLLPNNPNVIYAAAWRAERKPWTIISGGKEGGIYKSIDGGDSWEKLDNGLPKGLIGKIDLAVCAADSKVVYALIEAEGKEGGLYKSTDQGYSFKQISDNPSLQIRPFYFNNVDVDPTNPDIVYVNTLRFHKSVDGGKNWRTIPTPHGDNHSMWINPINPQLMVQGNDGGANVSHNGGQTWSTQFNQPTAELYQVEVDNQYPYWLYAGQQDNYTTISVPSLPPTSHQMPVAGYIMDTGGCETGPAVPKPDDPDIVFANCKGRFTVFNKRTGQEKTYNVGSANMYGHNPRDLKFRFQRVAPIHVSPHNPNVVYHTSQFVHKTTDNGKSWEIISPDLTAFEADKQVISGTPISRDITGEEFYSTIYAIRESQLEKGLIWVGANDGPIHVTRDGGKNWSKVTPKNLPKGGRVDAVEPSPHKASKAYAAILRYQLGDWKPYIYRTNNYGKSWKLITKGIPADYPVRVVREDPDREGLLYAGTEYGLFISFDDGENWQSFQQNLPVTPITDIKVHRQDLVLSTMGRGFWIMDQLGSLHETLNTQKHHLFKVSDTHRFRYRPRRSAPAYPSPGVWLDYYLAKAPTNPIQIDIFDVSGKRIRTFISNPNQEQKASTYYRDMSTNFEHYSVSRSLATTEGYHRFKWDMRHAGAWDANANRSFSRGPMAKPGKYTIRLTIDGQQMEQSFQLLVDPRVSELDASQADMEAQEKMSLDLVDLISKTKKKIHSLEQEHNKLKKKENPTAEDQTRMTALEALKAKLVTAKGKYPQPMLLSQMQYLYRLVQGADQIPGKDVYERFDELKQQFKELGD